MVKSEDKEMVFTGLIPPSEILIPRKNGELGKKAFVKSK
jgi:hypothetical protein